eukprot:1567711-Rhodomonas_salina.2
MAAKKGKREHGMALDTLKDLFVADLLPDRKLCFFHEQPLHLYDKVRTLLSNPSGSVQSRSVCVHFLTTCFHRSRRGCLCSGTSRTQSSAALLSSYSTWYERLQLPPRGVYAARC